MEAKSTVFDKIIFFLISVVISLLAMYAVIFISFYLITQIIGGKFTIGAVFVIGAISFLLGLLAFFLLYEYIYARLLKKSLYRMFLRSLREKQLIVKDSLILEIPPVSFDETKTKDKVKFYHKVNLGIYRKRWLNSRTQNK